MKSIIFKISSIITLLIPIKLLIKLTGIRVIYPFYHIVNNKSPVHIKHLYKVRTVKQFKKDLDFLKRYFQHTKDILRESQDKQNYFHLSFDDGLRECYDIIAPILKEYNIKATFFINSGFVDNKDLFFKYKASIIVDEINKQSTIVNNNILEILNIKSGASKKKIKKEILKVSFNNIQKLDKIASILNIDFTNYLKQNKPYLTSEQIKELLQEGHQIGTHSINHPLFSKISKEEQVFQTSESIKFIQQNYNIKQKLFAFPFTDDKVETSFFNKILKENIIDFSFGTAGIKDDIIDKNIQRIPIEKRTMSAKRYVKTEYFIYFIKRIIGKNKINRK